MKLGIGLICWCWIAVASSGEFHFHEPKVLTSGGKPIKIESPGFACPAWVDLDGDGREELLIGQFAKGKISVFQHNGDLTFGDREWLQAGGEDAEVPGVW